MARLSCDRSRIDTTVSRSIDPSIDIDIYYNKLTLHVKLIHVRAKLWVDAHMVFTKVKRVSTTSLLKESKQMLT